MAYRAFTIPPEQVPAPSLTETIDQHALDFGILKTARELFAVLGGIWRSLWNRTALSTHYDLLKS